MIFSTTSLLALVTAANLVNALTPAQWRGQSIYQVVTDRFARKFAMTYYPFSSVSRAVR